MALTSLTIPGTFTVLATSDEISSVPAWEYADGKRTDTQRTDDQGRALFSVKGLVPIIAGEMVADGSIHTVAPINTSTSLGQVYEVEGRFIARAASGFGLTGTLRIEQWDTDENGVDSLLEEVTE